MKINANHKTAVPVFVICLACVALVALLTYLSLWIGDDMVYLKIFKTHKRINNVGDIFLSQNIHYMRMNGRYVAHWLVQFMVGIGGRTLFTILNTFVYLAFVFLVARHSGVSLRRWPVALIVACACIVGFQTKFVPSCQIGYMWMFTLVLVTLYVFFHNSWPRQWLLLLLPLSLLAGEGQEALNVGVCGALIIYVWQQRGRISSSQWALLVAFFIGAAFLVLAPGSHNRLDEMQEVSLSSSLPLSVYVLIMESRMTWLMLMPSAAMQPAISLSTPGASSTISRI